MGQEDVLIEVIINGKDMLQFFSTKENYRTLYEDREALVDTVKTAFKEGILYSADIQNVEDIHSVQFLSDVAEATVDENSVEQVVQEGETYQTYEVVEEPPTLPSSTLHEELIIDCGLNPDERLNLCPHCDYRTFNVGHFKTHLRLHTGESPFECHLCPYTSKQKSNLKRHMQQHLLGRDHFACRLCDFNCTQEKVLKRHMILHTKSRPLRPCPFCDYFSTSLAHLTVHIRQHTGETPYHCGLCPYKTVQKSNLTRHLDKHRRARKSKADKLRGCVYCPYRTPNPAHLVAHIRAAHTGETPFACHICSYKSAQRSNLKRHLRKHSGERPFQCTLCNYSTAYPYVLKKHMEKHPDIEEINCDYCDFSTNSSLELRRHKREHDKKNVHSCQTCGFLTKNVHLFKRHLEKHCLEKNYGCTDCNYRAFKKSNLARHYQFKHPGTSHDILDSGSSVKIKEECIDLDPETAEDNLEADYQEQKVAQSYIDEVRQATQNISQDEVQKKSETETMDVVVNEEDIATTPSEDNLQVVQDFRRDEAGNMEVTLVKRKKPSFLNRKDTEQLKEFKRLLQTGSGSNVVSIETINEGKYSGRNVMSLEAITEEACLEDQPVENGEHFEEGGGGGPAETSGEEATGVSQLDVENAALLIVEERRRSEGDERGVVSYEVLEEGGDEEGEGEEGGGGLRIISCALCGFESRSVGELKRHIQEHTGESSGGGGTVPSSGTSGSSQFYYNCDSCDFWAHRHLDIARHKALTHGGTLPRRLPFICSKCEFRSALKEDFLLHLEEHKKRAPIKCKICELVVNSVGELKLHSGEHIGEEPFECYHCAYMTARKAHLRGHIKKRHHLIRLGEGPNHECHSCGYETNLRADFHQHIGLHKTSADGGGEAEVSFRCHFHGCRFLTIERSIFKKHIEFHTGLRSTIDSPGVTLQISGAPLREYGYFPDEDRSRSPKSTVDLADSLMTDLSQFGSSQKRKPTVYRQVPSTPIEQRLARKFNFNPTNLVACPKKFENGYEIEMVGEVYKAHASLRRFKYYGEVVRKSPREAVIIMSHPSNEEQLRTVYEQVKEMIDELDLSHSIGLTIYFREFSDINKMNDTLSDIEMELSDENVLGGGSGEDSDLDIDCLINPKPSSSFSRNGLKRAAAPEYNLDNIASRRVDLIHKKIKERNEKRKELRRLKALNISMTKRLRASDL